MGYQAAFAEAIEHVGHSPLYRELCRRVAGDRLYEDEGTFDYLAERGKPLTDWHGAHAVLVAVHSMLRDRRGRDELAEYYPVLGGHRPPDERVYQLFREFLRDRRSPLSLRMTWPALQDDPVHGLRVMRLLHSYLAVAYADPVPIDLLCLGAVAGLGLVADQLHPGEHLLSGHSVVRRRGVDSDPWDVRDPDRLGWLLSGLAPEDVAGQERITRAARLLEPLGVVVMQHDPVDAALFAGEPGSVPVLFGSGVLSTLDHPGRLFDRLRRREGDTLWISDETAGDMRAIGMGSGLEQVAAQAAVTTLRHFRDGEQVDARWVIESG